MVCDWEHNEFSHTFEVHLKKINISGPAEGMKMSIGVAQGLGAESHSRAEIAHRTAMARQECGHHRGQAISPEQRCISHPAAQHLAAISWR
jgi:hypothetical protein